MAVLTGMGFVSIKSLSKKSARRKYSSAAALKSPFEAELAELRHVGGDAVEATEMTP